MNENEKRSGDWKLILGGIALIAVLFVGIKGVFWGLEQVIPRGTADTSASLSQDAPAGQSAPAQGQDAPSFCVHCGRGLPASFEWGQFCPYCGEKIEQ